MHLVFQGPAKVPQVTLSRRGRRATRLSDPHGVTRQAHLGLEARTGCHLGEVVGEPGGPRVLRGMGASEEDQLSSGHRPVPLLPVPTDAGTVAGSAFRASVA